MASKEYCEIAMCGALLKPGTGSKGGLMICGACRAARYYWKRRGSAALMVRAERLQLYEERCSYIAPLIAANIKQAKAQLAEIHDRASRTAAARLGEARALAIRAAQKQLARAH